MIYAQIAMAVIGAFTSRRSAKKKQKMIRRILDKRAALAKQMAAHKIIKAKEQAGAAREEFGLKALVRNTQRKATRAVKNIGFFGGPARVAGVQATRDLQDQTTHAQDALVQGNINRAESNAQSSYENELKGIEINRQSGDLNSEIESSDSYWTGVALSVGGQAANHLTRPK